jgi:hypothetical protein
VKTAAASVMKALSWVRPASAAMLLVLLAACTGKAGPATAIPAAGDNDLTLAPAVYALVTYPADKKVPADYLAQITSWNATDLIRDVVVLGKDDAQQADADPKAAAFTSLAIVEFAGEEAYALWAAQSRSRLGPDAQVRKAQRLVHDQIHPRSAQAFYAVNHYAALISASQYAEYSQQHVVPNLAHQMDAGVMSGYAMYMEQGTDNGTPRAVLVKEYIDAGAFLRADAIGKAHEQVLLTDPQWRALDETKASVRTDLNQTLATRVVVP